MAMGCAKSDVEPDRSFWILMPSVENAAGPRSSPFSNRNTATSSGSASGLQEDGTQATQRTDDLGGKGAYCLNPLHLSVKRGGGDSIQIGRCLITACAEGDQLAVAARRESSGQLRPLPRSARHCSPCQQGARHIFISE